MTAPYTQQNYADWKRRFPGGSAVAGLLGQAKQVAGIEDEPQPLLTPPFNPNVEPQDPADLHEHKRGLLGGLRHLVGADRTAPEVAALLTPDQQKRARPGLLSTVYNAVVEGKGPQAVQQERALNMLNLEDKKKARVTADRQEAEFAAIKAKAEQMPVGPARSEFYARAVAEIMNNPVNAMQTAVGLREREFAPQAPRAPITKNTEDGIMQYNLATNQWEPMRDAEGRPMMAPPQQAPPNQIIPSINPDGTPGYTAVSGRGGEVKVTPVEDVTRPDASGRTTAAVREQVASNRTQIRVIDETLAELEKHKDATGLNRALGDDVNQRMDPPGVLARAGVANVGSLKIHDRTGAVMAAREQPRLVPFIPGIRDTYEANVTKLRALRRWIEDETAELERGMSTAPATSPPATPPVGGKTVTVNGKTFIIP